MLEASMSSSQARQILALPLGWSKSDLKQAFRTLAKKNHPDAGGDLETMKSVNAAYNVLKYVVPGAVKADNKKDYAQQKEREKEMVISTINSLFNPEKYSSYFFKKTGKIFSFKVKDSVSTYYFNKSVEWRSADNETVFDLQISVSLSGIRTTKSLGGGDPALAFTVILHPTVLHDNRKSKMRKKNWEFSSSQSSLVDPTKVFPAASIKKMMSGNDKKRKFSRRDMVTAIEQGMKGKTTTSGGNLWAYIPVGDYTLNLYRSVFMKQAAWAVHSVDQRVGKKRKSFKPNKFSLVGEDEKTVLALRTIQKRKWRDPQTLVDAAAKAFNDLNKKSEDMSVKSKMESILEAKKKSDTRKHYDSVMARGRRTPFDKTEYPPIRGMEGPFRYKSGAILYYDPKEGKYYDRGKDMYLSHKDGAKLTM
jgi:hypothetical protein